MLTLLNSSAPCLIQFFHRTIHLLNSRFLRSFSSSVHSGHVVPVFRSTTTLRLSSSSRSWHSALCIIILRTIFTISTTHAHGNAGNSSITFLPRMVFTQRSSYLLNKPTDIPGYWKSRSKSGSRVCFWVHQVQQRQWWSRTRWRICQLITRIWIFISLRGLVRCRCRLRLSQKSRNALALSTVQPLASTSVFSSTTCICPSWINTEHSNP